MRRMEIDVDRVATSRDGGDLPDPALRGSVVVREFAKRPLALEALGTEAAFDHHLRMRGYIEIDRDPTDGLKGVALQRARESERIDARRVLRLRCDGKRGMAADHDCEVHRRGPVEIAQDAGQVMLRRDVDS